MFEWTSCSSWGTSPCRPGRRCGRHVCRRTPGVTRWARNTLPSPIACTRPRPTTVQPCMRVQRQRQLAGQVQPQLTGTLEAHAMLLTWGPPASHSRHRGTREPCTHKVSRRLLNLHTQSALRAGCVCQPACARAGRCPPPFCSAPAARTSPHSAAHPPARTRPPGFCPSMPAQPSSPAAAGVAHDRPMLVVLPVVMVAAGGAPRLVVAAGVAVPRGGALAAVAPRQPGLAGNRVSPGVLARAAAGRAGGWVQRW